MFSAFFPSIKVIAFALVLVLITSSAYGMEWYWNPEIKVYKEYDDNPTFSSDSKEAVLAEKIESTITTGLRREMKEARLSVGFQDRSYDKNIKSDQEDLIANLVLDQRFQRSVLALETSYSDKKSLSSELEDIGLSRGDVKKNSLSVTPSWNYQLSDSSLVEIRFSDLDVDYESEDGSFSGYSYKSYNLIWQKQIASRWTFFTDLSHQDYSAKDILSDSKTNGLTFGANWSISNTWDADITAGYRISDSEYETAVQITPQITANIITDQKSRGNLFNISTQKEFVNSNVDLDLSKTLVPDPFGFLNDRDELKLTYTRNHNARVRSKLSYRYYETKAVQNNQTLLTAQDREYQSFNASLSWKLSNSWSLVSRVTVSEQQYVGRDAAMSTQVSFGILYRGLKRSTSF
jgi:hypothetical protein